MKTFYIGKEIQNNNKLYEGGVTMKTLTKMFLLACWCLCFVSTTYASDVEPSERIPQEEQKVQAKIPVEKVILEKKKAAAKGASLKVERIEALYKDKQNLKGFRLKSKKRKMQKKQL